MDSDRFDHLARTFTTLFTRRTLAGGLGLGALTLPDLAEAKKKRNKRKKKCKGGKKKCGKQCVDLQTARSHCGACGTACGPSQVCVEGLCWDPCETAAPCLVISCPGGLCASVSGVAVCVASAPCSAAIDCTADPTVCPAGMACAELCCATFAAHCVAPASP